jgi:hypothetical protein
MEGGVGGDELMRATFKPKAKPDTVPAELEIIRPGSEVEIGRGPSGFALIGSVVAVAIRAGNVQYEVAYWADDSRHCEWMEAHEVRPAGHALPMSIGFHPVPGDA